MGIYESGIGPNVDSILLSGTRVVAGKIPAQVRKELRAGMKAGVIGVLKRSPLTPEIFYSKNHPHPYTAKEIQRKEREYNAALIKKAFA